MLLNFDEKGYLSNPIGVTGGAGSPSFLQIPSSPPLWPVSLEVKVFHSWAHDCDCDFAHEEGETLLDRRD